MEFRPLPFTDWQELGGTRSAQSPTVPSLRGESFVPSPPLSSDDSPSPKQRQSGRRPRKSPSSRTREQGGAGATDRGRHSRAAPPAQGPPGSPPDPATIVLERRLRKAVKAVDGWKKKCEVESQANAELGRRVSSWKSAYMAELRQREELESELEHVRRSTEAQAIAYEKELERLREESEMNRRKVRELEDENAFLQEELQAYQHSRERRGSRGSDSSGRSRSPELHTKAQTAPPSPQPVLSPLSLPRSTGGYGKHRALSPPPRLGHDEMLGDGGEMYDEPFTDDGDTGDSADSSGESDAPSVTAAHHRRSTPTPRVSAASPSPRGPRAAHYTGQEGRAVAAAAARSPCQSPRPRHRPTGPDSESSGSSESEDGLRDLRQPPPGASQEGPSPGGIWEEADMEELDASEEMGGIWGSRSSSSDSEGEGSPVAEQGHAFSGGKTPNGYGVCVHREEALGALEQRPWSSSPRARRSPSPPPRPELPPPAAPSRERSPVPQRPKLPSRGPSPTRLALPGSLSEPDSPRIRELFNASSSSTATFSPGSTLKRTLTLEVPDSPLRGGSPGGQGSSDLSVGLTGVLAPRSGEGRQAARTRSQPNSPGVHSPHAPAFSVSQDAAPPALPPRETSRLFESLLVVGVPEHWDLSDLARPAKTDPLTLEAMSPRDRMDKVKSRIMKNMRSHFFASPRGPGVGDDTTDAEGGGAGTDSESGTGKLPLPARRKHTSPPHCQPVMLDGGGPGTLKPQVLFQYPAKKKLPCSNVADYCFPQGVAVEALPVEESMTSLNEVLYGAGTCQRSDRSFVFMFSGDMGYGGASAEECPRMYGVCVVFPRLHSSAGCDTGPLTGDTAPLSLDTPSAKHSAGAGLHQAGHFDLSMPQCYCLLSRYPFFQLHFQVLWDILAAERVVRMRAIAEAAGEGHDCLSVAGMASMYTDVTAKQQAVLQEVAQRFLKLAVPEPGCEVEFSVHPELARISYTRPAVDPAKRLTIRGPATDSAGMPDFVRDGHQMLEALGAWVLPAMLSWLPPETLVLVVGALMCEAQVVVVGGNLDLLSCSVLGLAVLLRPLLWVGPLIPILPTNMLDVLAAPVPYLLGIPHLGGQPGGHMAVDGAAQGQIVLDLDTRTVSVHDGQPQATALALPPGAQALLAHITPLLDHLRDDGAVPGRRRASPLYMPRKQQAAASEGVRAAFQDYVSGVCRQAQQHSLATEGRHRGRGRRERRWLREQAGDAPFLEAMVETQIYEVYNQTAPEPPPLPARPATVLATKVSSHRAAESTKATSNYDRQRRPETDLAPGARQCGRNAELHHSDGTRGHNVKSAWKLARPQEPQRGHRSERSE